MISKLNIQNIQDVRTLHQTMPTLFVQSDNLIQIVTIFNGNPLWLPSTSSSAHVRQTERPERSHWISAQID